MPLRCENSTERMLEYAATLDPKCKPTAVVKKGRAPGAVGGAVKETSWRDLPVEKRLEHALIKVVASLMHRLVYFKRVLSRISSSCQCLFPTGYR